MNNKFQALEKIFTYLQNAGVETRHMFFIKSDIESAVEYPSLFPRISLIRNDRFEVEYNVQTKEIRFSTTHQTINEDFINQMLEIHDMLPLMKEAMDYIFHTD